jgi:hypothetical protein
MVEMCRLELGLQTACKNAYTSCPRHGGYMMHEKIAMMILECSFYGHGLYNSKDNSRLSTDVVEANF